MRAIVDNLDIFRVVADPDQHLTAKTSHGGVFSAFCSVVIALLILSECYEFFGPPEYKSLMAVNRREMGKTEAVNFNISFLQFPCGCMMMEAWQANAGMRLTKQEDTLIWERERILLNAPEIGLGPYTDNMGLARTLNEGCRISGRFYIDKVPSNFIFACRWDARQEPPHSDVQFHDLWFGEKRLPKHEIADRLANLLADTVRKGDPPRTVYQYFLNIVPTIVSDPWKSGDDAQHVGFQYTTTSSTVQAHVPPGVYFAHVHSPVAVELTRTSDTWSHFLVNLASISGGVFTVLELLVAGIDFLRTQKLKRQDESLSGGG